MEQPNCPEVRHELLTSRRRLHAAPKQSKSEAGYIPQPLPIRPGKRDRALCVRATPNTGPHRSRGQIVV